MARGLPSAGCAKAADRAAKVSWARAAERAAEAAATAEVASVVEVARGTTIASRLSQEEVADAGAIPQDQRGVRLPKR